MILHNLYEDKVLLSFKALLLLIICFCGRDVYVNHQKESNIRNALFVSLILLLGVPDWLIWFVLFIVVIPLFSFYFASEDTKDGPNFSFFEKYSNVVVIISLISLFFWILGPILGVLSPNCTLPNTWGDKLFVEGYYHVLYETQSVTYGDTTICRNTGFMCEAPVYNLILCFALSYEIFINKKRNSIKVVILIITILSTLTTTGQLFLMFVFFLKLYENLNRKRHFKILFWMILPIFLYIAYSILSIIMSNKIETDSYESRTFVISNMIDVLQNHPFLGAGINKFRLTQGNGISNSLFHVMADGGFFLTGLFVYYLIVIPYRYMKKARDMGWLFLNMSFVFLFTFTLDYNRLLDMAILGFSIANANSYKRLPTK